MMTSDEFKKAVKASTKIRAFVQFSEARRASIRLSKKVALMATKTIHGDIDAAWADEDHTILLIG